MIIAQFFLKTMGSPALFNSLGETVRFRVRKHLGLLVYLATETPGVHRRDYLADLLWPSARAVNEGRHSLATGLSVIRAHLGAGAILATRDTVRLSAEALNTDIRQLQRGHLPGQFAELTTEIDAFLDPFELQDAEPFLRWRERMQARLLPAITAAINERIEAFRRIGNAPEMERLANRLLTLDPLNEHAVRAKMQACALAGDRVAALRAFEHWKEQLARELDAAPSDATERIASRLRLRGWDRASEIGIPAASTDQWRDRVFVGREKEYQTLYDAWERTRTRRPQHVLIEGEPGIGKTTLAERLTTSAALEGAAIARAKCYEVDRSTPYAALGFLVAHLLRLPGASATWPSALGELAKIAPEIRSRFPAAAEPFPSQGESARVHLAEAFHQLATAVADENPLIVVLDDIHLADDASLAALHLAIRRMQEQPILFLFTMREVEPEQGPRIAELRDAAVFGGFSRISLAPLQDAEANALIDQLLGPSRLGLTAVHRKAILAAGSGYPMALELLMHEWREQGGQVLAFAVPAMTRDLPAGQELPSGSPYRWLLDRLTLNLDEVSLRVLHVAALLGRRLNDLEFYSLVELSTGQTMTGLTRLKQLRLLRESAQGLEFANELIRARAYKDVPSPVRKALHSRIADRLLSAPVDRRQGLEIAWHCIRAGRCDEAVGYLLDGSEQAARAGAPHEAERALETAFPLLADPQRQRAAILLAELQQEQGRWGDSLATLAEHGAWLTGRWKVEAHILRVHADLVLGSSVDAHLVSGLSDMQALMRQAEQPDLALRAASVAGRMCSDMNDTASANATYQLAKDLPTSALDPYQLVHLSTARAQLAYHAGRPGESSEHLMAAKQMVEAHGIANSLALRVYAGLAALAAAGGNYSSAVRHCEAALNIATRLGRDDARRVTLANLALAHARLGNTAEQMRCACDALQGIGQTQLEYTRMNAGSLKAGAHAVQGQRAEAMETLSMIERQLTSDTLPWLIVVWKLLKADVLAMLGSYAEAKSCAEEVISLDTPVQAITHFEGKIAAWIAALAESPEQLAKASALIDSLIARVDEFDVMDRAEVFAAGLSVRARAGADLGELPNQLKAILQCLPPSCGELLLEVRLPPTLRQQFLPS